MPKLDILFEDNHLLAINKSAGLATMGVSADRPSLLASAKEYIKQRYHKPGEVYLGVVSRLDATVTGVILLARTSKAAARLNEQFRGREVEKIYWAVVEGDVGPREVACRDWIAADERHRRMRLVDADMPGAQLAKLVYRGLQRVPAGTFVEVRLETGRKHQIRLQLASRGHPVVGDRKYGSRRPLSQGIALHARRLVFRHPVRTETIELVAPVPASWAALGISD
ncbi:MAG: RluA family pseudouridine synthase [Pirellulales bacterium]|nr:RluA family pseudouridine synthase [Pirellulales bacterium]